MGVLRQTFFKGLLRFGALRLLSRRDQENVVIACLHRVSEDRDFFFPPIHPEDFEQLIKEIVDHYEVVSFSDVHKKSRRPKLVLSFDDGYHDFIDEALPILKRHSLPCNHNLVNKCLNGDGNIWTQELNEVFAHLMEHDIRDDESITSLGMEFNSNWTSYYLASFHRLLSASKQERTDLLDDTKRRYGISSEVSMMSWAELKEAIANYDIEVGSHTYTHTSLKDEQDTNTLEREIKDSIDEFEKELGARIEILSLPNGQYSPRVIQYSEELGLKYLLTVNNTRTPSHQLSAKFSIADRVNILSATPAEMFARTVGFHQIFNR